MSTEIPVWVGEAMQFVRSYLVQSENDRDTSHGRELCAL